MGEAAAHHPEVLPLLVKALRDANRYVRQDAAAALSKLMGRGIRVFPLGDGEPSTNTAWQVRTVEELSQLDIP